MDQLRSVLNQVGGDAKEMQQAMSLAFKQIIVGFIDVGKALGTFVAGAFKDTAASILKLAGDISGANRVIDMFSNKFKLMQAGTNSFVASMGNFGSKLLSVLGPAAVGVAAVSLAAFAVALGAAGFAIAAVIKEENELARALAVSGGSLGLNLDAALQYAEGMKSAGISTSKAMDVIREMSKTGKLFAGDISLITKTAVDMETYVGVSIEDTVKAFAKMRDKPVEAMIELAKATGLVPPEIIKMVAELESQGRSADASALAIKTLADVNNQQIGRMKQDYNGFSLFMIELGKSIGNFYDNVFKSLFTKASPKAALEKQLAAIEDLLGNNAGVVGLAVGGLGIGREGYEAQRDAIKEQLSLLDKANMKEQERIANNSFLAGVQKETEDMRSKQLSKEQKYLNEITVLQNKIAEAKQRGATTDQVSILQAEITKKSLEYQESLEKKEKKSKSTVTDVSSVWEKITDAVNRATVAYDEVVNGATKYTNSQKVMMDIINDPKFLSQPESLKAEALARLSSAHALEEQTAAQKLLNKAEEDHIKAIESINKEFEKLNTSGDRSSAIQQKIVHAFIEGTISLEEYNKALKELNAIREQNKEDKQVDNAKNLLATMQDRIDLVKEESEDLKLQKAIYGDFSSDQKKLLEYAKINRDIKKEELKIDEKLRKGEINDSGAVAAKLKLYEELAEKRKNIDQAAALETYKYYHEALYDVFETSIFEGGKAGSKKLRDFLVAELRKPITVVVNALVNTLMNSITGGVAGSAASSIAGSAAGSMLGGSSIAGIGTSILEGFGAASSGVGAGVLASSGSMAFQIGQAIAAVPVWGWIAGGLALLASALDDSGTMHTGGAATWNATTGSTSATAAQLSKGNALGSGFADIAYSQSTTSTISNFAKGIGTALDSVAGTFGKKAGYEIATAFADDTSKDSSWGSLVIKQLGASVVDWTAGQTDRWAPKQFADGEAGQKQYQDAVAKDMLGVLNGMDLPEWASNILASIGSDPSMEALQGALQTINQLPAAILTTIGTSTSELANIIYLGMQNSDPIGAGQAFADQITFGIESSLYQGFASQITGIISTQLVTPILAAMQTGATLTEAMSKASISTMISQVQTAGAAFAAIVTNPEFKAALASINSTIASAVGGSFTSGTTAPRALTDYTAAITGNTEATREATNAENEAANLAKKIADEKYSLETKLLTLEGNTVELRRRELATIDPSNQALQTKIWMLEDEKEALVKATKAEEDRINSIKEAAAVINNILETLTSFAQSNTDKALIDLEKAIAKQKQTLEDEIKVTEDSIAAIEKSKASLKSIFDMLTEQVKTLYGEVDSTSKQQAAAGRSLVQGAIASGVLPDQKALEDAIGAVRTGLDKTVYSTKQEADKARLSFAFEVNQLAELAGDQLSTDEQALVNLKAQLQEQKNAVIKLDTIVSTFKEQIDLMRGGSSLLDVETAINNLAIALGMEGSTKQAIAKKFIQGSGGAVYDIAAGTGTNSSGQVFNGSALAQAAQLHLDQGGTPQSIYNAIATSGYTLAQAEQILGATPGSFAVEAAKMGLPAFASGGMHSGGMRLVGENGPELEVTGPARYYNANQTSSMLSGSNSDSESIEMMRYELRAIAVNTAKLERLIDRVIVPTAEGEALQTKAVV